MNKTATRSITRRRFVGNAALGAGLLTLPSGLRGGSSAPSNKLNVALIGVKGRGRVFHDPLASENVVALCDINEAHLAEVSQKFPKAKTYVDWRKCLEQRDLDAVVICTADHTHAFISNWAMNRDLHVYCEKPLAITVEEVRSVRAKWLAKKGKLATQGGTENRPNHHRIRELIRDGVIGELSTAYAWGSRVIRRGGYWPAEGQPPPGFHYDLWLGPSPYHPYNPRYFMTGSVEGPGANAVCLSWNMFWDFGTGQIGDMGAHNMNLLWHSVDATLPTAVTAKGEPFNPEVTPVELECQYEHPANDWRGPITVHWSQGGIKPRSPKSYIDFSKITDGVMFKGSKGLLIGDYRDRSRIILPNGDEADMTYYKPRKKEDVIKPSGHQVEQWIAACKDPSLPTSIDFERDGNMVEQNLLGLVAYRAGRRITYDGRTGRVTDYPEANAYLSKEYRQGWTLDG